ncbi:MAG TPA: TspO/MBR family protein [Gemmatimonadaceae bacterium]|nr:TspO/MBR family protein [Gemmatimonadaceae bacterium]
MAVWLAITLAAGAIGGLASREAPSLYAQLDKPAWAPPAWLFGPVWTALYVMMGVAAWLIWRDHGWARARTALLLFLAQLSCNALWTWVFFAWRRGGLALAEIALLVLLVVATILAFARLHRIAGALLLPYLAWTAYATALTAALWARNPELL